jgi:hypothetical protein
MLSVVREPPQLAPPELETARAWFNRLIKLGLHTPRLFGQQARALTKNVFSKFQIEYYRIVIYEG